MLIRRNGRRIQPVPVRASADTQIFDSPDLLAAVSGLVSYVDSVRPQWIVGVNYGGYLLAAHVAGRLNHPVDEIGVIRAIGPEEPQFFFKGSKNYIGGDVLIIDDIVRTGNTLERIRSKILKSNAVSNFDFKKIAFATLFVADGVSRASLCLSPHWYHSKVRGNALAFPWTGESARLRDAFRGSDLDSQRTVAEFQKMIADPGQAMQRAADFIKVVD